MSKRLQLVLAGVVLLLVLSACAAGPNTSVDVPSSDGDRSAHRHIGSEGGATTPLAKSITTRLGKHRARWPEHSEGAKPIQVECRFR